MGDNYWEDEEFWRNPAAGLIDDQSITAVVDKVLKERKINTESLRETIQTELEKEIRKLKKNLKPQLKLSFVKIAEEFIKKNPLYYDNAKIWWCWNHNGKKWSMVDDTDILRAIVIGSGLEDAIGRGVKERLFEALKITARGNKPRDLPHYYIQLKDSIYDLKNDKIIKSNPSFFITSPIPWSLSVSDETPTIDKLFADWVGEGKKDLLYQIVAYCLLPAYPIHRVFFLVGDGMNGKSTFLRFLQKFLGPTNCVASDLELILNNQFEVARLYKKLVCFVGETNFAMLKKTSILKRITGEDAIGAQFKYKDSFDFINYAKIIISTNSLPAVNDRTKGFFRRALIIEFPNYFPETGNDIVDKIPELEFCNLVTKSLTILKNLLKEGKFINEGTVEEKREKYEALSNPLMKFIQENCQNRGYILAMEFYETFQNWLKERNLRVWDNKEIARTLRNLGYSQTRSHIEGRRLTIWEGISWVGQAPNSSLSAENIDGISSGQGGRHGQGVSKKIPYCGTKGKDGVQVVQPVQPDHRKDGEDDEEWI